MRNPTKDEVELIRKRYPEGTVIELIEMVDESRYSAGMQGTVYSVDDVGTIHMKWENGGGLGLIPGVDRFKVLR